MTKWEYKYELVERVSESLLNKFGERGWELVTIFQRPEGVSLYFKRPKKEERRNEP